ncbi:MAG: alkaline phosphatase D family protein [Betaproteobacteria bacterium]|nr:alkaline phosphatase D family protein [Betaproteobacteria bacterium]
MSRAADRRTFILATGGAVATVLASSLPGCSDVSPPRAEFRYGVASGDPLADRVILWTHARVPDSTSSVSLRWQVATDQDFANIVRQGLATASADTGFTVKVDADGLSQGVSYFYRFIDAGGAQSAVGQTRTLPRDDATSVKFAIFSCSLYSEGYFNAYDGAAKSDAQYALHLGDYIYEYGAEPTKYGNADAAKLGRVTAPATEIVSLEDYRTRYATYRADPALQAVHAKLPFIAIWDDHEFANNAWVNGAENHKASQGDWSARKANAARAWHEWLPTRTDASGNLLKIYRRFDFGRLLTLHMLDTRIEGRDQQYDGFGDADGGVARYVQAFSGGADASRRMMSAAQQTWLLDGIRASAAAWQVLGNQDIMARMWMPASVLQAQNAAFANPSAANQQAVSKAISDYLAAKATRFAAGAGALSPTQTALLNPQVNPRLPYNLDAWDGYPSQREAILQAVKAAGKRLVTVSGDSHNAWFANLTSLAGERIGWEFAGSSVTSPGFESVGLGTLAPVLDGSVSVAQLGSAAVGAGLGLVDDLLWADTTRRGWLALTVTASSVKADYLFVDTVKAQTYAASVGRSVTVQAAGTVAMS